MNKSELINGGEQILASIKEEDIFGISSPQECVSDEFLPFVQKWTESLVEYAKNISNKEMREDLLSLWIYNGRRVSSDRIKYAIMILNSLK